MNPHNLKDPLFWTLGAMALLAASCVFFLFAFLLFESLPAWAQEGVGFFIGRDWWAGETYGALPLIYGSLMVTLLALLWVVPLALAGAVFTSEFLPPRLRLTVKGLMELFAGVPGILYGLLGVALLSGWVQSTFGLIDGHTLLTAGLLLGIMVFPTILTVSEDALQAVPGCYRDAALSLGLTRWQTVLHAVLPRALPGIAGAVFLGLGRAMGETVAVMLVIGGLDKIPSPWFDIFAPAQSIPSKLGREAAEALGTDLHWSALMALGAVLFCLVLSITTVGNLFLKRARS